MESADVLPADVGLKVSSIRHESNNLYTSDSPQADLLASKADEDTQRSSGTDLICRPLTNMHLSSCVQLPYAQATMLVGYVQSACPHTCDICLNHAGQL